MKEEDGKSHGEWSRKVSVFHIQKQFLRKIVINKGDVIRLGRVSDGSCQWQMPVNYWFDRKGFIWIDTNFLPGNIVVNLRDAHVLYLVFGSRRHFIVVEYIYMLSNQSNILRA